METMLTIKTETISTPDSSVVSGEVSKLFAANVKYEIRNHI